MKDKQSFSAWLQDYVMYIVLIVLVIIFALATKGTFLKPQNLLNIVNQNVYLLIIGVGITFIMLSGAMDLSIGYQVSTIAVTMGLLAKYDVHWLLILIIGIALGLLLGLINGAIYAWLRVFPFIITLATQYCLHGATNLLSNAKTFRNFSDAFKILGSYSFKFAIGGTRIIFPIGILIMVFIIALGAFILNRTYFGRNIYALGSNPDAVALSGVSVAKMRILVFMVAGLFVAFGSIMNVSRIGASSNGTGVGAEFTVMAGAMLGGIKMGGGGGKMNNMVVGMFIIGLLNNGMNLMNLNQDWQYVALGAVLLLAIILDTLQARSAEKRAKMVMREQIAETARASQN